jgi:hypothetical protein
MKDRLWNANTSVYMTNLRREVARLKEVNRQYRAAIDRLQARESHVPKREARCRV